MDLWNGVTLTMGCTDPILQEHIIQKEGGGVIMSNSKTLFQVTKAFSRVFFFSFLLINQPLVHYHVQVDSLQKVTFVQRVLLINDIHLNLCTLFCFFILYLTKARLFIEYLTEFCLINWKLQNPLSFYRNSNCRNWFVKRSDKMKGNIWK